MKAAPLPIKIAIRAYAYALSNVATNAYNSGQCVLLYSKVYGGAATPPGAAAYRDWRCN